ncbi:MAG: tRNA (N6-threonylcarbamoyladenosine(37)-N6)-methyltransferase TrmO [Bacteroidales bacterium]|nr:tRNA (N6-threonylcarbamoyladenosine(37)-N6)-methyltransferase TrmO [Bacteroidales bacterium]MBN2758425.1 tRNA (N6-threonylcarbamoyladenosine(37)-N6)-methyltransferase TrmO [Bacteroidales bacterium]
MQEIIIKPIGIIYSPYKNADGIPIQGRFKEEIEAFAEIDKKYEAGLKDLDGFSHAILIYQFHNETQEKITAHPYLEEETHGIFAVRSPYRPNRIGLSIVKIKKIIKNRLYFTEVDVFDQTPLIDIKPYVEFFDKRENVKSGWVEKHFEKGIPKQTIL